MDRIDYVYDIVPMDDNRALSEEVLEECKTADAAWFLALDARNQMEIILTLLKLGGGGFIFNMYKQISQIYSERRGEFSGTAEREIQSEEPETRDPTPAGTDGFREGERAEHCPQECGTDRVQEEVRADRYGEERKEEGRRGVRRSHSGAAAVGEQEDNALPEGQGARGPEEDREVLDADDRRRDQGEEREGEHRRSREEEQRKAHGGDRHRTGDEGDGPGTEIAVAAAEIERDRPGRIAEGERRLQRNQDGPRRLEGHPLRQALLLRLRMLHAPRVLHADQFHPLPLSQDRRQDQKLRHRTAIDRDCDGSPRRGRQHRRRLRGRIPPLLRHPQEREGHLVPEPPRPRLPGALRFRQIRFRLPGKHPPVRRLLRAVPVLDGRGNRRDRGAVGRRLPRGRDHGRYAPHHRSRREEGPEGSSGARGEGVRHGRGGRSSDHQQRGRHDSAVGDAEAEERRLLRHPLQRPAHQEPRRLALLPPVPDIRGMRGRIPAANLQVNRRGDVSDRSHAEEADFGNLCDPEKRYNQNDNVARERNRNENRFQAEEGEEEGEERAPRAEGEPTRGDRPGRRRQGAGRQELHRGAAAVGAGTLPGGGRVHDRHHGPGPVRIHRTHLVSAARAEDSLRAEGVHHDHFRFGRQGLLPAADQLLLHRLTEFRLPPGVKRSTLRNN
ncbi:UNVERIFIED_CONTAM: hypothetical protein PYX00_008318 [Menopon gallinae]